MRSISNAVRAAFAAVTSAAQTMPPTGIAVLICAACSFAAVNGVAVGTVSGNSINDSVIALYNTTTRTWTPLVSIDDFLFNTPWGVQNVYNRLHGTCFSPDGKQIAYFRYQLNTGDLDGSNLVIMDNDGSNTTVICHSFNGPPGHDYYASWAANGYIYWSEYDQNVYRVNVTTKQREIVATLADFTGDPTPPDIKTLKVSLDGTRAGYMSQTGNAYGSYGLDFTTMTARWYGEGCQGTVSPNGLLQTRNKGSDNGIGYGYHQIAWVQNFDTKAILDTIITPGAVPGQSSPAPRSSIHRFSHSSNDHVVFNGEDGAGGHGFVACLSTNEYVDIAPGPAVSFWPVDYWNGPLPPPPVRGPVIALDQTALTFSSVGASIPANQSVTATNSGIGTLTKVTVVTTPSTVSWLALTVNGAGGNTQTITNAANPAGLASGAYSATVTVTGGGAANSANYAVTLNVGSAINAPTALNAAATAAASVNLSWTDNAANESGFLIERRLASGAWQTIATAAANASGYSDAGPLANGDYTYRVRAFAGTDSSGWSNEAAITLSTAPSLTMTAPAAGAVWPARSVQHIAWTAVAVTTVDLEYSLDDGLTWLLINGSGSVKSTMTEWGNYPFTVPDVCLDNLLVRVKNYGTSQPTALSAPIAVTGCSTARSAIAEARRRGGPWISVACMTSSRAVDVHYNVSNGTSPVLRVFRFDGRCVARVALEGGPGDHRVTPRLAPSAPGRYLAEIVCLQGGRQEQRISVTFVAH
jgi:hypothetical protein